MDLHTCARKHFVFRGKRNFESEFSFSSRASQRESTFLPRKRRSKIVNFNTWLCSMYYVAICVQFSSVWNSREIEAVQYLEKNSQDFALLLYYEFLSYFQRFENLVKMKRGKKKFSSVEIIQTSSLDGHLYKFFKLFLFRYLEFLMDLQFLQLEQ